MRRDEIWRCVAVTSQDEARVTVQMMHNGSDRTTLSVDLVPGQRGIARVSHLLLMVEEDDLPTTLPTSGEIVAAAMAYSPEQMAEVTGGRTRRATHERKEHEVNMAAVFIEETERTEDAAQALMQMGMSRSTAFRRLREARA